VKIFLIGMANNGTVSDATRCCIDVIVVVVAMVIGIVVAVIWCE